MYAANQDNPWVRDTEAARWRWPGWAAALSAVGFSGAVLATFRTWGEGLQSGLLADFRGFPPSWADILASGLIQCMIFGLFLAAAWFGTRMETRRLWRRDPAAPWWPAIGLALGSGGFCAAAAIAALCGAITPEPPLAGETMPLAILLSVAIVGIQSVSEEAFFRGWLQPVLCGRWGPWIGLLVTSFLFATLHIVSNLLGGAQAQSGLAITNLFLGGLLFGLLALRSGGLFAPAAAHFAWNWSESSMLGLDPQPTGSVFHLALGGPKLWSGGTDTMNGSLASTMVLLALTSALAFWPSRRPLAAPA
jgi:membrane protease YdiL (CAAX protease family)